MASMDVIDRRPLALAALLMSIGIGALVYSVPPLTEASMRTDVSDVSTKDSATSK